jgi:Farnesoic acid 0-methyl transferase
MPRGWWPSICGLALAAAVGCRPRTPLIDAPFSDDFERAELGPSWNATGPSYKIADGQLEVSNGYNHPAWLRRRLPTNVLIDVDVTSKSPAGDIKVELYGDGESFDPDKGSYTSTGYVLIFGGWHNSLSVICRQEEHGEGRKAERADRHVEPLRRYHFTIARRGGAIDWAIDGQPFLAWTDPAPFVGAGHEYFAVNDWEADVTFDNLHIRPAP